MVDVLFWNTTVNQECSGQCSILEHGGQSGVKWLMFYSGTQQSIRSEVVDVLFWNTAVNQECSGQCSILEHSSQSGVKWLMFYSGTQQSISTAVNQE